MIHIIEDENQNKIIEFFISVFSIIKNSTEEIDIKAKK